MIVTIASGITFCLHFGNHVERRLDELGAVRIRDIPDTPANPTRQGSDDKRDMSVRNFSHNPFGERSNFRVAPVLVREICENVQDLVRIRLKRIQRKVCHLPGLQRIVTGDVSKGFVYLAARLPNIQARPNSEHTARTVNRVWDRWAMIKRGRYLAGQSSRISLKFRKTNKIRSAHLKRL